MEQKESIFVKIKISREKTMGSIAMASNFMRRYASCLLMFNSNVVSWLLCRLIILSRKVIFACHSDFSFDITFCTYELVSCHVLEMFPIMARLLSLTYTVSILGEFEPTLLLKAYREFQKI